MGCSLSSVRVVKIEVLALCLLLVAFLAAGAVLIWQETSPAPTTATNQNGFAVYFYQNLSAIERPDAARAEEKPVESRPAHASFVLWLLGFPLASLGGLAIDFTLRGQLVGKQIQRQQPVQYILVHPQPREASAVSKEPAAATQRDISDFAPDQRANTHRHCSLRFRPAAISTRRENQPR